MFYTKCNFFFKFIRIQYVCEKQNMEVAMGLM